MIQRTVKKEILKVKTEIPEQRGGRIDKNLLLHDVIYGSSPLKMQAKFCTMWYTQRGVHVILKYTSFKSDNGKGISVEESDTAWWED